MFSFCALFKVSVQCQNRPYEFAKDPSGAHGEVDELPFEERVIITQCVLQLCLIGLVQESMEMHYQYISHIHHNRFEKLMPQVSLEIFLIDLCDSYLLVKKRYATRSYLGST